MRSWDHLLVQLTGQIVSPQLLVRFGLAPSSRGWCVGNIHDAAAREFWRRAAGRTDVLPAD